MRQDEHVAMNTSECLLHRERLLILQLPDIYNKSTMVQIQTRFNRWVALARSGFSFLVARTIMLTGATT